MGAQKSARFPQFIVGWSIIYVIDFKVHNRQNARFKTRNTIKYEIWIAEHRVKGKILMALRKVIYNKFGKNYKYGTLTNLVILAMSLISSFHFSAYFNYFSPFVLIFLFFIAAVFSYFLFHTFQFCFVPLLIILFLNILFRNYCITP